VKLKPEDTKVFAHICEIVVISNYFQLFNDDDDDDVKLGKENSQNPLKVIQLK